MRREYIHWSYRIAEPLVYPMRVMKLETTGKAMKSHSRHT